MKKLDREQAAETFALGAVLALAGGFLDAYSYLARGGVFANAETGNMVLLGINLLQGDFGKALHYVAPILAFALGVCVAEGMKAKFEAHPVLHWRQLTLGAELLAVLVVAFLPESLDMLANVLVSFTCAVQVESFRRLRGRAFATTMCTGNLRSGTEQLTLFWRTRDPETLAAALRYYGIIVVFIVGAALGALAVAGFGQRATLWCVGLLAVAFLLLTIRNRT